MTEASDKFRKAVSYKPDFPEALFKLGECAEKLKDTAGAIRNYRRCVRYLESISELSPEGENILALSRQTLEKIDIRARQLRDIKKKYISALLALANEYLTRKYHKFAQSTYRRILSIDPGNKIALDSTTGNPLPEDKSVKPLPKTKPKSETVERQVFNGVDRTGWKVESNIWLDLWSVRKPHLIFNGDKIASKEPSIILLDKPPPENYIFSMEVFIEKKISNVRNYSIGIVYGQERQTSNEREASLVVPRQVICRVHKIGVWEKLKFTKQGAKYVLESAGVTDRGNLELFSYPQIGIWAQGYVIRFRNIAFKELDK
ncbi:MAG: hypothetical protein HY762_05615 [Planctomycetes bacterium]|nr:hypothetical protein [Planctomycetota bacterium]